MTRNIRPQLYEDGEPRWIDESRQESVGPQGAALILELQRLRGAFDDADADGVPRKPRRPARDDGRPRQRSPKRRKGTIGRAIDVCLVQLGLNAAAPQEPRNAPSGNRNAPPRRRGPSLVPDGPRPLDMSPRPFDVSKFVPEQPDRPDRRPPRRPADGPQSPLPPHPVAPVSRSDAPPDRDDRRPPRFAPVDAPQAPLSPRGGPAASRADAPNARSVLEQPDRDDRRPPRFAPVDAPQSPLPPRSGAAPARSEAPNARSVSEQPDRDDRRPSQLAPVNPSQPDAPQLPLPPRAGTALVRSDTPNERIAQKQTETTLPRVYEGNQRIANRPVETFREKITAGVAFLVNRDKLALVSLPGDPLSVKVGRSYENELRTGLRVMIVGVVLIGGWAGFVPLSGAVTVPGNLVVQSNVKAIQHPTGGVVAEIAVSNGMRVEAGQLLVRLDATQARSSLQVVSKQLDEYRAKIARLVAERDGLSEPEFPADIMARSDDPGVKAVLASEQSLFNARTTTRKSQKELLQSRVAQLGEEITGLESQLQSKASEIDLIGSELKGVQELYDKRLVPLTRLTTLQRDSARIEGERGQMVSSIAETKGKIGEAQLQIVKIDQDFRTDVAKDLNDAQSKEAELAEHTIAAKDSLDRIELRAPTAGVVNQLNVHTIGGVIKAGDTIMEIVPDSDDLLVEAHVQPKDIDDVKMGQTALVAFDALNARTTPKLNGVVSYVSADASKDRDQLGSAGPVFTVRVMIPEEERRRLGDAQLIAGMPTELFLKTGSRTMLSYLFKPITEQLGHAFVER